MPKRESLYVGDHYDASRFHGSVGAIVRFGGKTPADKLKLIEKELCDIEAAEKRRETHLDIAKAIKK